MKKLQVTLSEGPTGSMLVNEILLDGQNILNVEVFKYVSGKHEVLLKIRVPDMRGGKMKLQEYTLPQDAQKVLDLSQKLQDLSRFLSNTIVSSPETGTVTEV